MCGGGRWGRCKLVVFDHGGETCFFSFGLGMRALRGVGCMKIVDFVVW